MTPQVLLRIIVVHRRLILANALGLAVLAALFSLLLPRWYLGRASILPPEEKSSEFSLLTAAIAQAPILANFATTGAPSEILARILESRTLMERVVEENDLMSAYKAKDMEQAVQALSSKTSISVSPEGVLTIRVLARSAESAAAMANSYVDALDEFNREKRITGARKTRIFIEDRLAETKKDLAKTEDALRTFEERYSSVEIKEQTKAALQAASDLLAEIVSREVELGVMRQELTADHPAVERLESELGELRGQLNHMVRSQAERDSSAIYVPFQAVPSVKLEMLRLTREQELLNRLYALLTEQYEQARIQEMRDTPTIQVLDRAIPPVRRAKPKRTLWVFAGLGVGLLGGIVMAFGAEGGRSLEGAPPTPRPNVQEDLRYLKVYVKSGLTGVPSSPPRG